MTELEHIEIEGFKGLEHVEFEPTDINLITGRNNTGKTSVLEAINILFNPKDVSKFEENIDRIVNIKSAESRISGGINGSDIETALRPPTDDETLEFFAKAMGKTLQLPTGFLFLLQGDDPEIGDEFANEISKLVSPVVEKQLESLESIEDLKNDFLIVSTNDGEYPYFSLGDESSEIISLVYDKIKEEVLESDSLNNMEADNLITEIAHDLQSEESDQFLDVPENTENAHLLNSTDFTEGIGEANDEENAIKIDDISDYLKDAGLVNDLKTFNPDYLVFEGENGNKYQMPFEFMGDGFKSIVGLLWELMDEDIQNDIVLIEEPENHMHPGYIRKVVYFLIELARKEDVQLFITTHDNDFINDFFTENLTDEEEAYLEDEFSLLRMEEDSTVVEDYETARENLKDLHLDLRGI